MWNKSQFLLGNIGHEAAVVQMLPPMGQVAVLSAATAQSSFLASESCLDCAVTPCRTMSHKLKTSHNSHATNITCHYSVTAPLKFWSQHSAANSRVLKTATLAELRSLFPSTHLGRETHAMRPSVPNRPFSGSSAEKLRGLPNDKVV